MLTRHLNATTAHRLHSHTSFRLPNARNFASSPTSAGRLAVRNENSQRRWERRAAVSPEDVKQLVNEGHEVFVERSEKRVFRADEYEQVRLLLLPARKATVHPLTTLTPSRPAPPSSTSWTGSSRMSSLGLKNRFLPPSLPPPLLSAHQPSQRPTSRSSTSTRASRTTFRSSKPSSPPLLRTLSWISSYSRALPAASAPLALASLLGTVEWRTD
jgi:hypothetical protein